MVVAAVAVAVVVRGGVAVPTVAVSRMLVCLLQDLRLLFWLSGIRVVRGHGFLVLGRWDNQLSRPWLSVVSWRTGF